MMHLQNIIGQFISEEVVTRKNQQDTNEAELRRNGLLGLIR